MRQLLFFLVGLMSLLGLASWPISAQSKQKTKPEKRGLSINEIMVSAHVRDIEGKGNRGSKRNLDTRVLSGKATDTEKERLLELYRLLAKATPPRGSLGKWKRYTEPLVQAMEGVAAGREGALEQLSKALSCKACHDQFQIGFYPGLSNLTDLKYYQRLQESGHFTKVSGPSLPPRELVVLAKRIKDVGGGQIIEQVSDGPEAWSLLVEFPVKTNDDAMRVFDSVRKLSEIRILDGGVTDKGLGYLRGLPELQCLVVNSPDITDDGMKFIATLKGLRSLDLLGARLTDKGLTSLAKLSNLKELYLYGADVRDAGIESLKTMQHLDWLYLPSSVTKAKLEDLRRALPKVNILRDEAW